jgi:hypothetical protein
MILIVFSSLAKELISIGLLTIGVKICFQVDLATKHHYVFSFLPPENLKFFVVHTQPSTFQLSFMILYDSDDYFLLKCYYIISLLIPTTASKVSFLTFLLCIVFFNSLVVFIWDGGFACRK